MGAPLPESLVPGGRADSAGLPWEGRTFDHHDTAFADDDGTAPVEVTKAITAVQDAAIQLVDAKDTEQQQAALIELAERHADAIAAFGGARFLIPLIAQAGDYGLTDDGKVVEKTQELSIVTVAAPDGRKAMPIFASVAAMQQWNPLARPIPVPGPQAAIAAAQEETDLIVINPGADTEFGIRRPALEAFALAERVLPSWADGAVREAFERSIEAESTTIGVQLVPGDPTSRLLTPELTVRLILQPGLDRSALDALIARLQGRWAADETIARRVDSLAVQLRAATQP